MTVKGKRIFNYRPLCVFAIALILGIILGEAVYQEHVAFIVTMCLCAALAFILLFCIKRTRSFSYIPVALLVGLIGITASNAVYDANTIPEYRGTFTAKVSSEIIISEDSTSFYITDIRVNGRRLKYDGYAYAAFPVSATFSAGDTVAIKGMIVGNEHTKFDTYYGSARADGTGYFASVSSVYRQSEGDPSFLLGLRLKIKRLLFENTDEYTASICQALLLGDKRGIDDELYANISASGLAHVLAVSGLHITTLAGFVYLILKKLKINPKIAFVIVLAITLMYSALCAFTASSLRAFVMCGVLNYSSAFGKKRDNLSALSLAAIAILIFRPTAIMEIGFLLSFQSVLGIFLFYNPFKKVGMKAVNKISPKRQIGRRFVDVCALSLSTNLMTFPMVGMFFGKLPTLFILSNFIVLPYVMACYIALLILTLLSLITTFGGFIWIMKLLLFPFRIYVSAIGGLSFATLPIYADVAITVCFTLLAVLSSRFIFAKKRTKAIGTTLAASASIVICALCALI